MSAILTIGAIDIDAKDQILLKSLIHLLDGQVPCRLRHSEASADCNVVFVPASWPKRLPPNCVTVRVAEAETYSALRDGGGLVVARPLRLQHVMSVLVAAGDLLSSHLLATASNGVRAVFQALTRHMNARERRITVFPLSNSHRLVVDFVNNTVLATLSQTELIEGRYDLAVPYRAETREIDDFDAPTPWRLRDLIWTLSAHLGDAGVTGGAFAARYRLQRWPDAVALARPGVPKLVALLTSRPLTFDEVCQLSGAPEPVVYWFLEAALALGIATPIEGPYEGKVTLPARLEETQPSPLGTTLASPTQQDARPLLDRLKHKFKRR